MHTKKQRPVARPEAERPAGKCTQVHVEEHILEEILRAAGLEHLD